MISDRELSAMVAEKVLGWEFYLEQRGAYRLAVFKNPKRDNWSCIGVGPNYERCDALTAARTGFFGECPRIATDAELALEAAMRAGSGDVRIVADCCAGFLAVAACATNPASAAGSTIARALCLAALRAAGVEVEDDAEKEERGGEE